MARPWGRERMGSQTVLPTGFEGLLEPLISALLEEGDTWVGDAIATPVISVSARSESRPQRTPPGTPEAKNAAQGGPLSPVPTSASSEAPQRHHEEARFPVRETHPANKA